MPESEQIMTRLEPLIERLARAVHDQWMAERRAQGWTYGPSRNDTRKEHPDLVEYDQLGEAEKELDRATARRTVKTMLELGASIDLTQTGAAPADTTAAAELVLSQLRELSTRHRAERAAESAAASVTGKPPSRLTALLRLWREHPGQSWGHDRRVYHELIDAILDESEPFYAYDVLREALRKSVPTPAGGTVAFTAEEWIAAKGALPPEDIGLHVRLGMALLNMGLAGRGSEQLRALLRQDPDNVDLLGKVGRSLKDLALQTGDPLARNEYWHDALAHYQRGYEIAKSIADADRAFELRHWTGINVAALHLMLGDQPRAVALASEVLDLCTNRLEQQPEKSAKDYWLLATIAEAELIKGDVSAAEARYRRAVSLESAKPDWLRTTRRQARLLASTRPSPGAGPTPPLPWLDDVFRVRSVIAFAGHMVDPPGRTNPRFPPSREMRIAQRIAEQLESLKAQVGFASAANGADILFLEAMQARGGETHVVLPFDRADFIRTSVALGPDAKQWARRFSTVLDRATSVREVGEYNPETAHTAYDYGNRITVGLAVIRAAALDAPLHTLAVWDGQPGGPGGTADTVAIWRRLKLRLNLIPTGANPTSTWVAPLGNPATAPQAEPAPSIAGLDHRSVAMLFADAVGFSKLREDQIPVFMDRFLGGMASMMRASPVKPLFLNTWGDGLYMVFDSPADAATTALKLREFVRERDWAREGLSDRLNLRIALHAGPVFEGPNPLTQRREYNGSHVSRTARIEPVTPAGEVFCTEQFAALAAAAGLQGFETRYVGVVELAKSYGFARMHLLMPRSA